MAKTSACIIAPHSILEKRLLIADDNLGTLFQIELIFVLQLKTGKERKEVGNDEKPKV